MPGIFNPVLFIGIGGMGKSILLRIRRMIVENYKRLEDLPSVRFLHVDTDQNPAPDAGSNIPLEVMGQHIGFKDAERCLISRRIIEELQQGKERVKGLPAIQEWFDPALTLDNNFAEGAAGIRPYGRLAFHYAVDQFRQRVSTNVELATRDSNRQLTAERLGSTPGYGLDIYIISSLVGGTGSGTFLEVCYNTREVVRNRGGNAMLIGTFTISGAGLDQYRRANCYAALKELEYHATAALQEKTNHFWVSYPIDVPPLASSDPPVDLCYLVSHLGEGGYNLERNQMEEAIALKLFMDFSSVIADEERSRRVDFTGREDFRRLDEELHRTRQFLSFGIATLEFPAPRVQDMMAHEVAAATLRGLLFSDKKEKPNLEPHLKAITDLLAEPYISQNFLTIEGGQIPALLSRKLADQERNVADLIRQNTLDAELLSTALRGNIEANIRSVQYSPEPENCGEYVRQIKNNALNKQKEIGNLITETVHIMIEKESYGPGEAKAFLDALASHLADCQRKYEERFSFFEGVTARAQGPLNTGYKLFRESIGAERFALEHHNKKIHTRLLPDCLNAALKREAFRAAQAMLKEDYVDREAHQKIPSLKSIVKSLQQEIDIYTNSLQRLAERLHHSGQEIAKTIINTPIAEGIRLSKERLRAIVNDVVPDPLNLRTRLLRELKLYFSEKDRNGQIISQARPMDIINHQQEEAVSWLIQKCNDYCAGVRQISVAQELKDKPNLDHILAYAIRSSQPMLQAAGFQQGERVQLHWLATYNTGYDGDLQQVCRAIKAIFHYGGSMENRHLEILPDPYRIIFASEIGIFPLQRITLLQEYRKEYLLTHPSPNDRRINYPDILPAPEEGAIRRRIGAAILLGAIFGFLEVQTDPGSGYDFFYLSSFNKESQSYEHLKLTEVKEDLAEFLFQQQFQKQILRKEVRQTSLEKLEALIAGQGQQAVTKWDREKLWCLLQQYLECLQQELPGGDRHEEYGRQRDLIQDFRAQHRLEPPTEPCHKLLTGEAADLARFQALIRTFYKVPLAAPKVSQEPGTPCPPVAPAQSAPSPAAAPAPEGLADKIAKFKEVIQAHLNKGITDRDKNVRYGVVILKLPPEVANQAYDEVLAASDQNISKEEEYKEYFELLTLDGELNYDKRQMLRDKQAELQLSDETIRRLEAPVTTRLYREVLEIAVIDRHLSRSERDRLKELQQIYCLSHEQVKAIEADYDFQED